jgi:hypothetical protein
MTGFCRPDANYMESRSERVRNEIVSHSTPWFMWDLKMWKNSTLSQRFTRKYSLSHKRHNVVQFVDLFHESDKREKKYQRRPYKLTSRFTHSLDVMFLSPRYQYDSFGFHSFRFSDMSWIETEGQLITRDQRLTFQGKELQASSMNEPKGCKSILLIHEPTGM